MLSKEASVKVKVNASFKRFLCLLLVLLMFPLDALAVVVPGGGTNIGYAGGKTTKFRFREYVGIALGIQQMQGDEYRVGKPTEDEVKSGKMGTSGMARVVQHLLDSGRVVLSTRCAVILELISYPIIMPSLLNWQMR